MFGVLNIVEAFHNYIPLTVTLAIVAAGLSFANWALKKRSRWVGRQQNFVRHLVILGLSAVALISVIIALPIGEGMNNQLTEINGLSSTSLVSNAMAGFILRSVGSFRSGDFIEALPEKIIFDKADEAGNAGKGIGQTERATGKSLKKRWMRRKRTVKP